MDHHRRVRMAAMIEEVLLPDACRHGIRIPGGPICQQQPSPSKRPRPCFGSNRCRGEADGPDPLRSMKIRGEWPGQPDIIMRLPNQKSSRRPESGYWHIEVLANNEEAAYVGAIYVKPGNRRCSSCHCTTEIRRFQRPLRRCGDVCGRAPGTTQEWHPEGTGSIFHHTLIRLSFIIPHAVRAKPTKQKSDCTSSKTSPNFAERAYRQCQLRNSAARSRQSGAGYLFDRAATLYSVTPHMHLRGKWMQFELCSPMISAGLFGSSLTSTGNRPMRWKLNQIRLAHGACYVVDLIISPKP